jgi:hypothetical protein
MLYAAIEKVKWNPAGTGGVSAFDPVQAAADTSLQAIRMKPTLSILARRPAACRNFVTRFFRLARWGIEICRDRHGRASPAKVSDLFSDGFKLFETDENGMPVSNIVLEFLRELVDAANRSSVVFYAVDGRGLVSTALTAEDSVSSAEQIVTATQARGAELLDTQEGLSYWPRKRRFCCAE